MSQPPGWSSVVKLHINIQGLKLSRGTVRCKHRIVPQFTLMRTIYIYIAPFIPKDLRVPHRLNTHGSGAARRAGLWHSQPGRKITHQHCLIVLGKGRFWQGGRICILCGPGWTSQPSLAVSCLICLWQEGPRRPYGGFQVWQKAGQPK